MAAMLSGHQSGGAGGRPLRLSGPLALRQENVRHVCSSALRHHLVRSGGPSLCLYNHSTTLETRRRTNRHDSGLSPGKETREKAARNTGMIKTQKLFRYGMSGTKSSLAIHLRTIDVGCGNRNLYHTRIDYSSRFYIVEHQEQLKFPISSRWGQRV